MFKRIRSFFSRMLFPLRRRRVMTLLHRMSKEQRTEVLENIHTEFVRYGLRS